MSEETYEPNYRQSNKGVGPSVTITNAIFSSPPAIGFARSHLHDDFIDASVSSPSGEVSIHMSADAWEEFAALLDQTLDTINGVDGDPDNDEEDAVIIRYPNGESVRYPGGDSA
jgi:hypothetical protein